MPENTSPPRSGLTVTQWLICIIASIGFAFDIYELLMMPLIVRDAITQLTGTKFGTPEYRWWLQMLFFLPFFVGGLIGMVGGYVTDLLGRRRVLTWSILLYAISAFAAGYSTSMPMLLILRCLTLAGVCIEFVAAIAWLAELFPDPVQRERVLGYTQAFSSLGGILVSVAYIVISKMVAPEDVWRYTLMSGVIPAIPLIVIRPFLPESPAWEQKRKAGTLRRPSFAEIFSPALRRTTIVTAIMFACSYGAAFGAIQQLPQIVPGIPSVAELPKESHRGVIGNVQLTQEIGGMVGRLALAYLIVVIASRGRLIRLFQVPGLILVPLVFAYFAIHDLTLLKIGIFFVGFVTVAQFSFWGNYLPGVYPLHLRGTGESFAANFGGRILGTSAALVTAQLVPFMGGSTTEAKFAYAAAVVGTSVYVIGFVCSFFLPEPTEELPE